MIELRSGGARATVLPARGAALGGFWKGGLPVLHPTQQRGVDKPLRLGLMLLVPFSNRVSGGGFTFGGAFHPIAPNRAGDPLPIHGDAFQRVWQVADTSETHARLRLAEGHCGPIRYVAEVEYSLSPDSLDARLAIVSTSEGPLPFGAGFHPWFPRSADTRLSFRATGAWPENADNLPATTAPVPLAADGQGSGGDALPPGFINQAFAGWDGRARIRQGAGAVGVDIESDGLTTAILHSPGPESGFFCLEPVTHPVDAHNLPGQPGLAVLAPGEELAVNMTLRVQGPGSGERD